ncbi:MAG: ATP-binding cassette domain-containing protein [Victivallales bacterium]|nr:ATP-binding cassette domain-containing protein [Victivallales bacterium]
MDILRSEHFELWSEPALPFLWLRVKEGGPSCHLGNSRVPRDAWRTITSAKRQLIFREEFLEPETSEAKDDFLSKRLLGDNGEDYTDEVRGMLPAEMKPQYVLETDRLFRRFGPRDEDIGCNGAFLQASPGEITAIMGPSGAGKSVFLKMLCGYDRPSGVLLGNGLVDMQGVENAIRIHDFYGGLRKHKLGYVPQGDVMYPELTTEESLRYRVKMQFGGILSEEDIHQCIVHSCLEVLKLDGPETMTITGKSTVKKQIGQMEWQGDYPSGGQRRRINIAHELVLEPSVLILDEPTSGLSSGDSRDLMEAFSRLAKSKQLCIIMTIHQPSDEMFRKIDDLLLLARGGRLAYYGKRSLALDWVKRNLKESTDGSKEDSKESANEADNIIRMVGSEVGGAVLPRRFEEFLQPLGNNLQKYTSVL